MAVVPGRLFAKVADRLGAERKISKAEAARREEMRKLALKYETRIDVLSEQWGEERAALKSKQARVLTRLGEENKRLRSALDEACELVARYGSMTDAKRLRTALNGCEGPSK